MADEREFTTLPRRALADRRLCGMDLRVLGAIGLHDGLSIALGKGQGCYAGDRRLAQTANTDRKNVKRATDRLIEYGYLRRDTDTLNRRGFVMRVIPDSMAEDLAGGEVTPSQQGASSPPIGGEVTPAVGGEVTPEIKKEENQEENHRIDAAKAAQHAFSVKRRDDDNHPTRGSLSWEAESAEAGLGSRPTGQACALESSAEPVDREALAHLVDSAIQALGSAKELSMRSGVSAPYISRARYGRGIPASDAEQLRSTIKREFGAGSSVSLRKRLPAGFFNLESTAQIPILERTLSRLDWRDVPGPERDEIECLLFSVADAFRGEPTGEQAQRLYESLPC